MELLHDGMLLEKSGTKMLKAYLEIKRQLKYCQKNANEALEKGNKSAYNSWMDMVYTYSISLQILEGKEL
jgi:hypothetical protein